MVYFEFVFKNKFKIAIAFKSGSDPLAQPFSKVAS